MTFLSDRDYRSITRNTHIIERRIDLRGLSDYDEIVELFFRTLDVDGSQFPNAEMMYFKNGLFQFFSENRNRPVDVYILGIRSLALSDPELALELVDLIATVRAEAAIFVEENANCSPQTAYSNLTVCWVLN